MLRAVVDVPGGGKCLVGVAGRDEGAESDPESGMVL